MKTKIPRAAFLFAGVAVIGWILYRRHAARAADAAANASYGGWPIGAIPASFSYLNSAAPAPTGQAIGSLNPADAMALQLLQVLTMRLAGSSNGATTTSGGTVGVSSGGGGGGGLETPFVPAGYTSAQVAAAAARYAQGRSYQGAPYVPHMVMQEGHIEVRNGVPGTYIKYSTGAGSSTEWTPLR